MSQVSAFKVVLYGAVFFSALNVRADVLTQKFSITDSNVFTGTCCDDVETSVPFAPFDSSLGVLKYVQVTAIGMWGGDVTFQNPFPFTVNAHLAGDSSVDFGPSPSIRNLTTIFFDPIDTQLLAGETRVVHGSFAADFFVDLSYLKDDFIGFAPLDYSVLVWHLQNTSKLFDLSGVPLPPPQGGNYGPASYDIAMTQDVRVNYYYCPTGDENCATLVPEPSTYALTMAGLGSVAFAIRRRKRASGLHAL